jgi:hypothetical protein
MVRQGKGRTPRLLLLAGAALVAGPGFADFPGDVPDRIQVQVGSLITRLDTEVGANVADGSIGTTIQFEDAFGLSETNALFRLEGNWRIKGRHQIEFGHLQIDRANTTRLSEEIVFEGYTFQANAEVRGTFEARFPMAAYRYDMLQLPQVRIAVTAGVCYLRLAASLEANGGVLGPGGITVSETFDEAEELEYPVPLVGLRVDWAISRRFAMQLYHRYFYLDRSDFSGDMIEGGARIDWFFSRHLGAGVGFERTTVTIRSYEEDGIEGRFNLTSQGANLYLKVAF